ncbi:hypothetical protein K491DRAFT_696088 [Lophiostoma macrostomum CBS 122681]|uniref:Cora-domain-containing protein n=1 Tax=Lophiostoma macrostomum CBS 122681 TaxID=1314788 RepID=A0A6A6SVQ6_9PLEO|nr:hypothetical protein K491DRAFT_696088 [Lophiostoma macrostomum CBS 122681]
MKAFGDCWKADDTSLYLHRIQTHCHQHPSLKLLHALPHVSEHPTRIRVLEFRTNGITEVEIDRIRDLEEYWSNLGLRTNSHGDEKQDTETNRPHVKGRLYLIEDISLPYISSLGSHFNIDPRFFVEYLKFDPDRTQNFLSGYHTMRRLSSLRSKFHHATFVYHEIRTFEGTAPRREEYEILTRNNVRRLVTTVDHHTGQFTGLVRRNLGMWWRNASLKHPHSKEHDDDDSTPWNAVILIDPPMTPHLLIKPWSSTIYTPISCPNAGYLDGYLDFSPWTHNPLTSTSSFPSSTTIPNHGPYDYASTTAYQTHSMLLDISHYWRQNSTSSSYTSALRNPRASFLFAHRILASHWNLQLEYLVSVVSDLEKGLLKFEQMDAHPRAERIQQEVRQLRLLLSDVNAWRRRLFFYLEQVEWNVEAVSPCLLPRKSGDTDRQELERDYDVTAAALSDFTTIRTHLLLTTKRIQSLLPVVMGAFSLLEAQHSVLKADLTIRLSSVALVFVPLSFTASLLSMSDEFMPGRSLFWVYFVVSGPLILALFWWAFWVQIGRVERGVLGWCGGEARGRNKEE